MNWQTAAYSANCPNSIKHIETLENHVPSVPNWLTDWLTGWLSTAYCLWNPIKLMQDCASPKIQQANQNSKSHNVGNHGWGKNFPWFPWITEYVSIIKFNIKCKIPCLNMKDWLIGQSLTSCEHERGGDNKWLTNVRQVKVSKTGSHFIRIAITVEY